MEWEALLLGLEPLTAAAIGVGVAVAAPVVAAIDSATGSKLSESARSIAKEGMVFAFDAMDNVQSSIAEAQESVQDLMAEAKNDLKKARQQSAESNGTEASPQEIEIS